MNYRIMLVSEEKPNNASSYTFYRKKNDEGFMSIFETADKAELDTEVESLLNKYAKKDFIIVQVLTYNIDTDINKSTTVDEEL